MRRGHHLALRARKWSTEYGKRAWFAAARAARVARNRLWRVTRKTLWLGRRWVRRKRHLVWRLITMRKIDPFGRTRTLKRALDLEISSLDTKPFEIEKLDRRREIRALRSQLSRAASSQKPVVVGPWLSEIGFELLYWIPFVQWAKSYAGLREQDLWIVSRGGVKSWYQAVSSNYLEIFDHFDPDEFRQRNLLRQQEQGGIKHRSISSFDEDILRVVRDKLGTDQFELLHPSTMYEFFQPFFQKVTSFRLVEAFSFYSRIRPEPAPPLAGLPEEYVAVKFYGNDALPSTPANRSFLASLLSALTRRGHVVALDTGLRFDDHAEYSGLAPGRLHTIDALAEPSGNLELQTRLVANARTLYCTYGGFSYLAPLVGTRTVTFYSDRAGFRLEHLELARRVFAALDCPPFLALDVERIPSYLDLALLDRPE